ncbi:MAG: T9SS type A sorting domain-containing protein [Bacteroidetes bacterium]|nr:T9SS type A sorting domain-containing protein [Bacteroidota bacterium]MBK9543706.1 T9SS type A sorting domain-containing protein [Bacteroidota bacterium]MBP6401962.1 T9SS type A sorting domain-containing protein [Bacteroidia bacterium]
MIKYLLFFLFLSQTLIAQWPHRILDSSDRAYYHSISDSKGGVFIERAKFMGGHWSNWLHHISEHGYATFPDSGIMMLDSSNYNLHLSGITSDRNGGYFVGFIIDSGSVSKFYIDWRDSLNNSLWMNPLLIDTSAFGGSMRLEESSPGNVFVVIQSNVCKTIWVNTNRLSSWQFAPFCPSLFYDSPKIKFNGNGKAYILYQYSDSVFLSCVDSSSGTSWPAPVLISSTARHIFQDAVFAITSIKNIVVAWEDSGSHGNNIKIQRLDSTGVFLWGSNGKYLDTTSFVVGVSFDIASNGHNGCFLTGGGYLYNLDSIGSSISPPEMYGNNCQGVGFEGYSQVYLVDSNHALVTWTATSCPDRDGLYAQYFDFGCNTLWPQGGLTFYWTYQGIYSFITEQTIVNDDGSAICVMSPDNFGIFANRLPDSTISNLVPEISSTEFQVYPNPSNGLFNASTQGKDSDCMIKIFDVTGSCIYSGSNLGEIDLRKSARGIYCVVGEKDGHSFVKRLILQ